MPTTVLDAYSKAFPLITNRIRAAVFLETDLSAPVATIIDSTVGHPVRIYHFPGLQRANYAFSLDEINGSGDPINNLAYFDVVPSAISGVLVRDDEQIKVGTTPGFDNGNQVAVFDGTSGKPNYVGWRIVPSELTGRGILVEGLDYSWDAVTGTFTLLQAGDKLITDTWYNIHFDGLVSPADSIQTINDFSSRIVTADDNILVTDFGANIIVESAGPYIELQLPAISTIPQGRPCTIETVKVIGSGVHCVKLVPNGADVINFLRGSIYLMDNESICIYRFRRPDTTNEWRVRYSDGNFKKVGQLISQDYIQTGAISAQLTDGSIKDKFQYARIYNEHVLNLPAAQVVNYDDWLTGNNKYFFSLANSANPANANKFHFPDRRNLFERNNNAGKAGDFFADNVGNHQHRIWGQDNTAPPSGSASPEVANIENPPPGDATGTPTPPAYFFKLSGVVFGGTGETTPKHYLINKYVLI
jgi:hypothetical protein